MIRLENISAVFAQGTPDENRVIDNINLTIRKNEFVTVIGANGAGKSTLYNIIAGALKPASGKIYLRTDEGERDITCEPEYKRARYIGRIFQNPLLGTAGKMTLEDNMTICYKKGYRGLTISLNKKRREIFRRQLKVLNMGLEDRLSDNVEQFSGGQRQALTLLMSVMSSPRLLLLDEHPAALDPRNAAAVMDLTVRFAEEYNLTVMMITHNMAHALEYGDRLLMLDRGTIALDIVKDEKSKLSVGDVAARFRDAHNKDLTADSLLLQ